MQEVNKDIVMSDSFQAMAELQDYINYILENSEFNKNALLLDAYNLLAYKEVIKNNSLYGLYLANKGLETLIIGGIDYVGTLQYKDALFWDKNLKKEQHIIKEEAKEEENTNNPFLDYVIALAKNLKDDEYGIIKKSKDIWKIMPFDNSNER
ncbi:hypothetical protein HDR60_02775 [bacterium]|nr:hypothetical protein [bacterium]